jgi:hypothetical protein
MTLPGFTAETAGTDNAMHYRAAANPSENTATVQPALFISPPVWCLKHLCKISLAGVVSCAYYVGRWNSATGHCE